MVEHFRTALRAVVAADDVWRAGTMARSSAEYVALDAACRAAGLGTKQRTRARQHFPDSAAWRFYMGEYSACLAAAQAMEVPHV